MTTYVAISVFGKRAVFTPTETETGDLIGAAAGHLKCLWVDVLDVQEVKDTPETMQDMVAKIRELAETPREFAVGVASQYLYDIDQLAEMVEVAAGWRRSGSVGRWVDDADVESNARAAASELAKQAIEQERSV
jgi:hypothetical protein